MKKRHRFQLFSDNRTLDEQIKEIGFLQMMDLEKEVRKRMAVLKRNNSEWDLQLAIAKSGFYDILEKYL